MKESQFFVVGLTAVILLMSSCIIAVVDYSHEGVLPPKEEFYDTFSFEYGGTLSLQALNGNIEIKGWEKEEVEIYAEKGIVLPHEKKVRIYSKRGVVPRIKIDRFEDFTKIRTEAPSSHKEAGLVDYFLKVPHSVTLKNITSAKGDIWIADLYGDVSVKVGTGNLSVDNFSGSLEVLLEEGSISVSLMDLREEDEISLVSKSGDIEVYLQQEVSARIEASAPRGEVDSEFEFSEPAPEKKVVAELGKNGAAISLNAMNGDIRIKVIEVE